ncbi:MAG TPA: alfa-L-rhamnosidase, partial [Clostridiales bacterium]|nr:alfa-L-rhamnosidase [Clostridiales bacterium]
MLEQAKWIMAPASIGTVPPEFTKTVTLHGKVKKAIAEVSALGNFEFTVNGARAGEDVLSPGWTSYSHRVQAESYDITRLLKDGENTFSIYVGNGWAVSDIGYRKTKNFVDHISAIAEIRVTFADGHTETFVTDESFSVWSGIVRASELYDGEEVDLTAAHECIGAAVIDTAKKPQIIPRVGEIVKEHERVAAKEFILTPKGERVIDFGQNLAGYPEIRIKGKRGERISLSCAEVLDKDGNFYTENYRFAKSKLTFT